MNNLKITIIGAGLSGCSLARILKDRGHNVVIFEKNDRIGGLCVTDVSKNGIKYEPFGAHTFHTKNQKVIEFITRFNDFNGYIHKKGMILNNKLFPFPMTKSSINLFSDKEKILKELNNLPQNIDNSNFETACLSIFGETLYHYFIKNYTEQMWGMNPTKLTAEWAPKRLELVEKEQPVFGDQWQGLPVDGYSKWLKNMVDGINVFCTYKHNMQGSDVVISTAPIDETMNYRFGKLQYRSFEYKYEENGEWENDQYGTINLPQSKEYIRKCNFKILHKQESNNNFIQYQKPVDADDSHVPMYPVSTKDNNIIFDKYLKEICRTKNICPSGRLALFKYLDMDKAIEVSFDMINIVENYLNLDENQRYQFIKKIREKY